MSKATVENNLKLCYECNQMLPINHFGKDCSKKDGLNIRCKKCYNDLRRDANREYQREWRDNNHEHVNQYSREYYQNNPDKYHQKLFAMRLNAAVYTGKIIKPDNCTLCHSTENIQGHHPSYEPGRELDVIWVCTLCHAKIHIQLRHEEENGGPILD